MEDQIWDFFMNNSPKLVEKSSSRAKMRRIEKVQETERNSTFINPSAKESVSSKKLPQRMKSASRVVYRDVTPIDIASKNTNNRVNTDNKKLKPLKVSEVLSKYTQNQSFKLPGQGFRRLGNKL